VPGCCADLCMDNSDGGAVTGQPQAPHYGFGELFPAPKELTQEGYSVVSSCKAGQVKSAKITWEGEPCANELKMQGFIVLAAILIPSFCVICYFRCVFASYQITPEIPPFVFSNTAEPTAAKALAHGRHSRVLRALLAVYRRARRRSCSVGGPTPCAAECAWGGASLSSRTRTKGSRGTRSGRGTSRRLSQPRTGGPPTEERSGSGRKGMRVLDRPGLLGPGLVVRSSRVAHAVCVRACV
jgi:hypothetical protein